MGKLEGVPFTNSATSTLMYQHHSSSKASSNSSSAERITVGSQTNTEAVPAPVLRPTSRGCRHCVSCCRLQYHRHSTTFRTGNETGAEWWPGGLQSPNLYFHLRARQLYHQIKYPSRSCNIWRNLDESCSKPSELLARRRQPPMFVQIPITCTNVPQADTIVTLSGEKTIKLILQRHKKESFQCSECHEQGGFKLSHSDSRLSSQTLCRMSQDHHSSDLLCRLSGPMDIDSEFVTEAKRRCTDGATYLSNKTLLPGHALPVTTTGIANCNFDAKPNSSGHKSLPMHVPIYPGKVLEENPASHGSGIKMLPKSATSANVVTAGAPLSAGSEASSSSSVSIADFGSSLGLENRCISKGLSSCWDNGADRMGDVSLPVFVPVLQPTSLQAGGLNLVHYYQKKAMIKDEHAFPCHQVLDLTSAESINGSIDHAFEDHSPANPLGYVFRTIAGTIKRNL